jgi:hypothetical protein
MFLFAAAETIGLVLSFLLIVLKRRMLTIAFVTCFEVTFLGKNPYKGSFAAPPTAPFPPTGATPRWCGAICWRYGLSRGADIAEDVTT